MNKKKLTWGLILLFIGIIFLLSNLNIINFYWWSVFRFWPVFLIVVGVNLLVPKRGLGNIISVVVTVLALAFLAWQGMHPPGNNWWNWGMHAFRDRKQEDPVVNGSKTNSYAQPYEEQIKMAHLVINGGAIDYEIEGKTNELFRADTKSTFGRHSLETKLTDSVASIHFKMQTEKKGNWRMDVDENSAKIKLSDKPVWNIDLEMGAGSAEFDLSPFKIGQLNLKGGAVAFEIKLGMPLEETVVNAESGAASVEIKVPEAAACRIVVKSGLSSKEFSGFEKQADGSYLTDGYDAAGKKFLINLKGGLSSFVVERYH